MIVNRIGDFGLALGIFYIFHYFCALDYATVFSLVNSLKYVKITFIFFELNLIFVICLFLFFGAIGKSAQIGLHI